MYGLDVVLKALVTVVIRWFSLNEAPLGLIKFISDYLPDFEKINIFFNIITKKFELIYKDWSKLFATRVTWCVQPDWCYLRGLHDVYNLIEVISSWIEQKLGSALNYVVL